MEYSLLEKLLQIKRPIIQAPMNWLTSAKLVASVSNAGGLGVLGPNAGQNHPQSLAQTKENIQAEIQKTKRLTNNPFGLNILLPSSNPFSQATLAAGLAEKVPVFVTVGPAEADVFTKIKQSGARIIHRPLTPTIKNMREAQALGADVLVATGFDEGGILPQQAYGTFTLLPSMVDAVNVPVLAAGGINDARGVKAALALGASGVYLGTRFLATKESPMAAVTKKLLVQSNYEDLVAVSASQRSIKTKFAMKMAQAYAAGQQDTDVQIAQAGGLRPAMLAGKIEQGIVSVNTGISLITSIPTVEELVNQLI